MLRTTRWGLAREEVRLPGRWARAGDKRLDCYPYNYFFILLVEEEIGRSSSASHFSNTPPIFGSIKYALTSRAGMASTLRMVNLTYNAILRGAPAR